ncbi:MAG: hypothetical protein PHV23_04515 [Candidatus Gracilibacteria bacterium]|nr:hypothetical protein [Candidatus Gracilibacteria bacterium]
MKIKKLKKSLKKYKILSPQYTRWTIILLFSLVVGLKIIENTSDRIYDIILTTPEITNFTKIQESAFFFFM